MIKEFQGDFRWLSNFTPVNIELDGLKFSSVEHAYMSAKSDNKWWKEFCANPKNTPGQVKRESKKIELVENWNQIKLEVMRDCVEQKFSQEPFRTLLKNTRDLQIQEGNNWGDKFWGVCLKTNKGENNLGKLIMNFRRTL